MSPTLQLTGEGCVCTLRGGSAREVLQVGQALARRALCTLLPAPLRDTYLTLAWLVEHHLLMSKTAQRKDISDPNVINDFAANMHDRNHLNYLYLLTVADIQSTNPALWNRWKEVLLAELYQKTLYALRRGLEHPLDLPALIAQTRQEAMQLLKKQRRMKFNVERFWQDLGDDYFVRHAPDEIAWHTSAISSLAEASLPLIVIREETFRGGTEVFIYMKDQDYIFAASTTVLDRLGLNIVDARILTADNGYTLDTYIVLEKSGHPISGRERREEIGTALRQALTHLDKYPRKVSRARPRHWKHFPIPTRVAFSADEQNNRTIMEVSAADRPGFLARIGMALTFCGVRLKGAKIATYGARIEDIFFITDQHDQQVSDLITCECLQHTIMTSLDAP